MKIYFIDLFCGAGGVTMGIHLAKGEAEVIACINHDPNAIESHKANHPNCLHFTEDIRTFDTNNLKNLVNYYRSIEPDAIFCIWASLECTNYSKAKGGLPRDADSRTLANHLFKYIESVNPDYLWIENVVEFMAWGPLDEKGRPVSRRNGSDFLKWIGTVQSYGYTFEHKILNSADFGAYTSRKRLFIQFAKHGLPITWPSPTHSKNPAQNGLFGKLKPHKAVKDVLELDKEGVSIFARNKPLSDRTLERIYAGLVKFIANGDTKYIKKYYSGKPNGKVISIDGPCGTITTVDSHAIVSANFLNTYYGNGGVHSSEQPSPTLTTKDRIAIVNCNWIDTPYKSGTKCRSVDIPAGTITTVPKMNLTTVQFMKIQCGQSTVNSLDNPSNTITAKPKMNLVSALILNGNYNNGCHTVDQPAPTITASRMHHYLLNPQWGSKGSSIENPCFTLIARMDKTPPYLISASEGMAAILIYETDSEIMIKIKQFMAVYGIVDIKMRMLFIPELKRIMGFPTKYILKGTKTEQKKFIGNAVEVNMAKALIETHLESLLEYKKVA